MTIVREIITDGVNLCLYTNDPNVSTIAITTKDVNLLVIFNKTFVQSRDNEGLNLAIEVAMDYNKMIATGAYKYDSGIGAYIDGELKIVRLHKEESFIDDISSPDFIGKLNHFDINATIAFINPNKEVSTLTVIENEAVISIENIMKVKPLTTSSFIDYLGYLRVINNDVNIKGYMVPLDDFSKQIIISANK